MGLNGKKTRMRATRFLGASYWALYLLACGDGERASVESGSSASGASSRTTARGGSPCCSTTAEGGQSAATQPIIGGSTIDGGATGTGGARNGSSGGTGGSVDSLTSNILGGSVGSGGLATGGASSSGVGGVSGNPSGGRTGGLSQYICVPHGSCRAVRYIEGEGCVETVLPDGAACNDGHVCTGDDHCASGECVGTKVASEAREDAVIHGFGGYSEVDGEDSQHGLVVPLSEQQLVFADRTVTDAAALTLVNVTEGGALEAVDRYVSSITIERNSIASWVFAAQTRATLTSLTPTRFVFAGRSGSQVFDVVANRLVTPGVDPVLRTYPLATVGRGNQYWTCDEGGIYAFSVEGTPPVSRVTGKYIGGYCRALALSDDGHTLFAGTDRNGLHQLKITETGGLELVQSYLVGTAHFNLAIQGDVLIAKEMYSPMGRGPLKSYRWTNGMELLGQYLDPLNELLGFAVTGSQVFAERLVPGVGDEYELLLQGLDPQTLTPTGTEQRFYGRAVDVSEYYKVIQPVGGFGLLVSQPLRRVFRVGANGEEFAPLTGAHQGFFESVYGVDKTHAVALDAHGRHDIDLTDPGSPRIVSTVVAPSTQPARLVIGNEQEVGTWLDPLRSSYFARFFTLATVDAVNGFTLEGRVKLGSGLQAVSGDQLVTLNFDKTTNRFLVQLSQLEALQRGQAQQVLSPDSEYWFEGTAQPATGTIRATIPGVLSADAHNVVVADVWSGARNVYLHWFTKADDGLLATNKKYLEVIGGGPASQVFVSDRFALVVTGLNKLLLIENAGDQLILRKSRELASGFPSVVRWTKDFIYVAKGELNGLTPSLELLSSTTLETVAAFPLEHRVVSLAEVGEHVVASGWNGITVLTPRCAE